jgi:voltage-gated potassium channel
MAAPYRPGQHGPVNDQRRIRIALGAFAAVVVAGTCGYRISGFGWFDSLYQTVTTVTTVGFQEVHPLTRGQRAFTMIVIVVGVGTALYAFSAVLESLLEGRLRDVYGRKRMERRIESLSGHVIVCGWGRVGRSFSEIAAGARTDVVVIDADAERLGNVGHLTVIGDATEDDTLRRAGIDRARALVAALDTDSANLFVTLSARAIRPELFIVARVRLDTNTEKLRRAGANRVVNPQSIGGARMAAFVLQPNVAEFLDVVMHDGSTEFRLEEVVVAAGSSLSGMTLRDAHLRDRTGALVLATRQGDGTFATNPPPEAMISAGQVLIAIGTAEQLTALEQLAIAER